MAYSDFTLAELKSKFQLTIEEDTNLFADIPEAELPSVLTNTLARYLPLAVNVNTGLICNKRHPTARFMGSSPLASSGGS